MAHEKIKDPLTGAETTGHVWDDNLMEFDNPLPRWWLWAFYGTVIFTVVYFVMYPSWPTNLVEGGYMKGVKTITYTTDAGEEVTTHWNTRALLAKAMQTDKLELRRQAMVKSIAATPINQIAGDVEKSQFVLAYGKGIFGDYCAACHQAGGQGVVGHYPNLIDDAWLWGGDAADIEASIRKGRKGNMPAHSNSLSDAEITQVAHYVLSLSGEVKGSEVVDAGKVVFNAKGCSGCHTPTGVGMKALGSANLTDKVWTQANVPDAADVNAKVEAVKSVVSDGIKREMPAWESRLEEDEIKVLVAYIKLLAQ
ncbi:MAG: cytochrome-c oxidase, cbb3-type subunit III [Thiotrichaceae bacterium]